METYSDYRFMSNSTNIKKQKNIIIMHVLDLRTSTCKKRIFS